MKFALAASAITTSFGPHSAVDGYQVGRARLSKAPAHDGERHPDGDELLYATPGRSEVRPIARPRSGAKPNRPRARRAGSCRPEGI